MPAIYVCKIKTQMKQTYTENLSGAKRRYGAKMGKIFCVIGKSGTGKDTVFKALMEFGGLGLRGVVTYTTRPRRGGETDSIEYRFITDSQLEAFKNDGRIIELRQYDTVRGVWSYCTVDDGQIDLEAGNYLMIVTLAACESLVALFGKDAVVPLYIRVEDGLRLQRALDRERLSKNPDYKEMCRRFLADDVDFSAERLSNASIAQYYDNDDIDRCAAQIRADILCQIK